MDYSKHTLLLVDDEAIITMANAEFLQNIGYSIIKAFSGEDAIDLFREGNERIDLILMDFDLGKGMNGLETAREISKIRRIPVIFFTSYPECIIEEKIEFGLYGYVAKNSNEDELLEAIRSAFKRHYTAGT